MVQLESLRARIRAALGTRHRRVARSDDRVAAAVLVLFVEREGEMRLVFAKKTDTVPHHKGQFSFPGGVMEPSDLSPTDAALREAREEVGLDPALVEVLGLLDDTPTGGTNFVITPVVGICREAPTLRPDGREIERVVEIPLRQLRDPACFREELWERGGALHPVVFYTCGEHVVWGTTGRILRDLLTTLFP